MQPYVGSDSYGYISHSYRDKERIDKYIDILQKDGYRFWMDLSYDTLKTAGPGNQEVYHVNIPKMIEASKVFIVFISNASARSMNIKNEINYAVNSGKTISVAYLDNCEISDGLKSILAGKKTVHLYNCRTLEESVNQIKSLCPDSIHPVLDTIEDELKELFLTETYTAQEAEKLVNDANLRAGQAMSAPSSPKEEYNYYIVMKQLDSSGTVYKAPIKDTIMVGRGQPTNAINLNDMYVARLHCQIKLYDGQIFIRDNHSTNHTFCDNRMVSSDNFERITPMGRYRIGRFFYSISLDKRVKPSEDSSRTVYYKAMLDEFQVVAQGANQISTKSLLMDNSSLVNQKFNEALKKWNRASAARYIIDLLCDNLDITFEREERHRIYDELNLYNSIQSLSKETYDDIFKLSAALINFAVDKLKEENASQYIKYLDRYMDPYYIAEKIVEYDSNFVLYFLTPIFDLDEEQLGYILKHVLKRKGVDFYDQSEFLLWVAVKVDTDSRFALLTELNILYNQIKTTGVGFYQPNYDDDDIPVTVYIGYNAEENYLDRLDERIELKDVRTSELVNNMLKWHIKLERKTGSSATARFYELYKEVNTLYASEIADIKVMKKNMNGSEPAPEEAAEGKRGSYNVSLKYDGSGKITFKYSTSQDVLLPAGVAVFESNGRFNRVNGRNEFAPVSDVEIKAGSGEITLTVKCISENPFQMAKLRKKGTASIAEKDTISLTAAYSLKFDEANVSNKPICIFFEKFTSTGDIREYLYSDVDRKDLLDEWFYGENKLSVDLSLFEAEWFIDSRLTDEIIEKFDSGNGYEQRCGILLMLYMKFCKENFGSEMPYQQLIKKFTKLVDYEMDEIRFDGLSFGNSFDCLLCYLLMTSSPTDNLRLLYKEAFR